MNKDTQLATTEPSVAIMLQQAMAGGVTAENVAAVSQLVALYERMQDKQAERDYAAAFVKLQSEMPKVHATKGVPNSDGSIRYKFAPFEEIMRQVQGPLRDGGFTVTFDQKIEEGRISAICTLMHVGGHSRSNTFSSRIGKGPPGSSETQADGAASTYAKRFALCNALNIVVEHDDDARAVGSPVTALQARELKQRVERAKADEAAFLKFAGAANYESIPCERWEALDEMLFKKELKAGSRNEQGDWLF